MTDEKRRILDLAARYVCPDRVRTFEALGVDLVIGRREGYRLWDLDGHELLDFHLNGGVFNLGHRNPELVATLRDALDTLDIGNHHFPSAARAELAEALVRHHARRPALRRVRAERRRGDRRRASRRRATRRKRRTDRVDREGLPRPHRPRARRRRRALLADCSSREGPPGEFVQVPFNDLDAMEAALSRRRRRGRASSRRSPRPTASRCPRPATCRASRRCASGTARSTSPTRCRPASGAPARCGASSASTSSRTSWSPARGCRAASTRSPRRCSPPRAAGWLDEDGWGHVSTFGGAELGCRVAQKVLEITTAPEVRRERRRPSRSASAPASRRSARRHPDWFVEIRRAAS